MSTKTPGALGVASHREGVNTLALGEASHAEGEGTQAQGKNSHSEGIVTAAIGTASHSEGAYSVATGQEAHAEGHGTFAKNFAQHAEGMFNKGESNDTIHETGIGTDDTERKNGFEIYWNGDVKAPEQTFENQKSGDGKHLVTIEYLDKKNLSVQKSPDGTHVLELDFGTRETNFFVDFDDDIYFKRPKNMKRGQKGEILFCNQTLDSKMLYFDAYCLGEAGGESVLFGGYSVSILEYRVVDENNIFVYMEKATNPHLPIQIGSGDYLAINTNGDALLN